MATIKIACPKCGQKVSGDESFAGTIVECPVCSSQMKFPSGKEHYSAAMGQPISQTTEETSPPAASPEAESISNEAPISLSEEERSPMPTQAGNWEDDDGEVPSPLFGAMSLVSGILGIVTCVGSPLFAPLAIIFGHIGLAKGKRSPIQPAPGKGLAVTGLIIGYLSLLFVIGALIAAVIFKEQLGEYFNQIQS